MAKEIVVERLNIQPIEQQGVEIVERKGIGHPDSICDATMNQISIELSKEYLKRFGAIMHHNIDKSLLVAGGVEVAFGGGKITEPMLLVIGDRATFDVGGVSVPVKEIALKTTKRWIKDNLRFVDPEKHMRYQVELKKGSSELVDIFSRKGKVLGANDTSAAVGYAPLSETETLVLETERYINSKEFKKEFPESGEDIKIMGVRAHNKLHFTIAMAFVDRFIDSEDSYFKRKKEIEDEIRRFVSARTEKDFELNINTLDEKGRGINGVYLSVLGTSAESGDCGQVGRGNRVNGVIPLNRPTGSEAAAGKNPVSHVGKIYNMLTHRIANEIYEGVDGVSEVYVWLVSQIGRPIDNPKIASAQIVPKNKAEFARVAKEAKEVIKKELDNIGKFCNDLAYGKLPVC